MSKRAWKIKKKRHIGWIIFGVFMTVFIVLPVTFVFGAFYDPTTKNVSDSDIHYENLVSEAFYKGIENMQTKDPEKRGKLNFTIDENMIDGITMAACDKLNKKDFIPKIYCYINKNNYDFVVDLQAAFFKTRVILHTSLSQSDTEFLTFNLKGITVGRLPIPINWVTGIAGNFISDEMINGVFDKAGFHIKSDLAHAKLTYKKEDFKNDVGGYVDELGQKNEYLGLILDVINSGFDALVEPDYYNGVSICIDLNKLVTSYIAPMHFEQSELTKHKQQITAWLNNGYLEEKDVANMFTYLLRGFALSNDDIQTYINSIDVSSEFYSKIKTYLDIENLEEYEGTTIIDGGLAPDSKRFQDYCSNAEMNVDLDLDDPTNPTEISVTFEKDVMNKYLAKSMTDAIGKTIPITYKNGNDWKFEYIFISDLSVDFSDRQEEPGNPAMNMYLSLSIDGFPICMQLVTDDIKIDGTTTGQTIGDLTFDIDSIKFGQIAISDIEILSPIFKMMPQEGDFVYHSEEGKNGYFAINLDKFAGDLKEIIISIISLAGDPIKSATSDSLTLTYSK